MMADEVQNAEGAVEARADAPEGLNFDGENLLPATDGIGLLWASGSERAGGGHGRGQGRRILG